ncbi:MAG: hypothetical protein BWY31_00853 [Lentisphaerae bacterium ADurb.Bin242]|nr:MAG: hypothetical protein BWY31_00853 [Lentisphaerae bacterium ADurb.Bin242]
MKFAIGYRQTESGEPFQNIVSDYRGAVAEVYFPWPGLPTGRPAFGTSRGARDWSAQAELEEELSVLRGMGVKLDLLFNANCYGARAVGEDLRREVESVLSYLEELELLPEIVTTASPFIAWAVKAAFPSVETRASVNMRIDSVAAMEFLSDLFDSFHIRRDLQRDPETVAKFHAWCAGHGKKLCMLANSGCLRCCPFQTFHDNLLGHDAEIAAHANVKEFHPHLCRKLYADKRNVLAFLRSTWLRPEDLAEYEPFFDVVKLATRTHPNPRMVLGAYASGHFSGNLFDLTEPGFSGTFAPYVMDNRQFPPEWKEVLHCKEMRDCTGEGCGKCSKILERVFHSWKE